MTKKLLIIVALLAALNASAQNSGFCGLKNSAFSPGEKLTYRVYYNVSFMYVGAGEVTFTTSLENLNGVPVYHVKGEGHTYHSYDWIFKVRDRYETYIDTASMLPLKFIRDVNEGDYHKYNTVTFDPARHTALSRNGTYQVPPCVQDVMSAIYYARNIDFDHYKPGDKIYFSMFLDDQVYRIYIRYLGKEEVTTRYGTFHAIKFSPLLIKGTIFQGGEGMRVWVSDDANRVPLRVNSPITVGSIKVDLTGYSHLRHPFTALISKK
jgi:hypothetical protein